MKRKLTTTLCALLVLTLLLAPCAMAAETETVTERVLWEFPEQGASIMLPASLWVLNRDKLQTAYGADEAEMYENYLFMASGYEPNATISINAVSMLEEQTDEETREELITAASEIGFNIESIIEQARKLEQELGLSDITSMRALTDEQLTKLVDGINECVKQVLDAYLAYYQQESGEELDAETSEILGNILKEMAYQSYVCENGKYLVINIRGESSSTLAGMTKEQVAFGQIYITIENGRIYLYTFSVSCLKADEGKYQKLVTDIIDSVTYTEPVAPV